MYITRIATLSHLCEGGGQRCLGSHVFILCLPLLHPTCIYICMYVCMYVCICVCVCVCMYVEMYICMYLYRRICVCLHTCISHTHFFHTKIPFLRRAFPLYTTQRARTHAGHTQMHTDPLRALPVHRALHVHACSSKCECNRVQVVNEDMMAQNPEEMADMVRRSVVEWGVAPPSYIKGQATNEEEVRRDFRWAAQAQKKESILLSFNKVCGQEAVRQRLC